MLDRKMEEALNRQVSAEFYAAYIYLAMAAECEAAKLDGMAQWLKAQSVEEIGHAMRIYNYVNARGGRAFLGAIPEPPKDFGSPLACFEAAYAHEQRVTGMIADLVETATRLKDHATVNFLQWFVAEQVEEEEQTSAAVERIKMVKDAPGGLYIADKEFGARQIVMPVLTAAE